MGSEARSRLPSLSDQEAPDGPAAKLEGLFAGLPADEQSVFDAIIAQAAALAWSQPD